MAYLDTTTWNTIQQEFTFTDPRRFELGIANAMPAIAAAADFIMPSEKERLKTISSARSFEITHIKDKDIQVYSTPSFDIPANLQESGVTSITTYDIVAGFKLFPDSFNNNVVDINTYVKKSILDLCYAAGKKFEEIMLTEMLEVKTPYLDHLLPLNGGEGTFTFDDSADVLKVSKDAQTDVLFYKLNELMRANEVAGNYHLIGSPLALSEINAQNAKYGNANDKNLSWTDQYLGMDRRHSSYNLDVDTTTNRWEAMMVREGEFDIIPNHPAAFDQGRTLKGGTQTFGKTDTVMPFINLPANVYTNIEATNAESLLGTKDSNLTMTTGEEQQYWFRFHVVRRPNTSAAGVTDKPTGVLKLNALL